MKIDKLKFAVRDSKHATLINFLRPLATGLIKSAVTKALEAAVRSGLEQLDMQLSDLSERLEDANQQEGTSKIDALKQSFNTKKNEAERKKERAEELAREYSVGCTMSAILSADHLPSYRSGWQVLAHSRPARQARYVPFRFRGHFWSGD